MDERDIERAKRLLEQVEAYFKFEDGLIDPVDFDTFTCADLLRVADGEVRLADIPWQDDIDPEHAAEEERGRLVAWNAMARGA